LNSTGERERGKSHSPGVETRLTLKNPLSLFRSPFIRDTSTLVVGTAAAHLINLALMPILTRLYTSDQFGTFSLYMVVLSIGSVMACLSYEPALVLPGEDQEAEVLLGALIRLAVLMAAVSLLVVLLLRKELAGLLKAPDLFGTLLWLPVNLLTIGLYQAFNYRSIRYRRFQRLSLSRGLQAGATDGLQIGGGLAGGGIHSLVLGQIVGQVTASYVLAKGGGPVPSSGPGKKPLAFSRYLSLLVRYRNFPLYSTWGTLMNVAASQNVPVILSMSFGTMITGYYFMAVRLVSAPMALIGNALGQVLLQRASKELTEKGSVSQLVAKTLSRSLFLWMPVFLLAAWVAPGVISLYLGPEWKDSGRYIQALTPLFFLQIVTSPISVVLIALQKQRVIALIQGLLLMGSIGSLTLAALWSASPLASLFAYSLCQAGVYLIYLGVIMHYSSTSLRSVAQEISFFFK
jgi:O-antigen/teichoic acid export membrane protein